MLGIVILICLLLGPRAGWVKRFLPTTANRVVFVTIVSALIVVWVVQAIGNLNQGVQGEGYFGLAISAVCAGSLYRFISEWWLKDTSSEGSSSTGRLP